MRAIDIILKKRAGGELTREELAVFVHAATHGDWPDYQLSALLMAIFFRGMTPEETANYTHLMAHSGTTIDLSDLPGVKVDKHSTGGVGDKTSLILAPLAVACGAVVPMMSGRGLGHTGGTLDKLESIPGFNVHLSIPEFKSCLKDTGCGMIGQTKEVAPSDKKLYALRDVTGTVECIPLITGSILSKKLAEGISGLVMDVKCGAGAFMKTLPDARKLAESIVRVGRLNGLNIEAVITRMEAPLGRAVGNALEVIECIECLKSQGPKDLTDLSVLLAAKMVRMAGGAKDDIEAEVKVRAALASGVGLEVFRKIVARQGGNPKVVDDYSLLPTAKYRDKIVASTDGVVSSMNAELVGVAAMRLGAGRASAEHHVNPAVGVIVQKKTGETVKKGETIYDVHHDRDGLDAAMELLDKSYTIGTAPVVIEDLVLEVIR